MSLRTWAPRSGREGSRCPRCHASWWLTKTRTRSRARAKVSEGGFFPSDKETRRARHKQGGRFSRSGRASLRSLCSLHAASRCISTRKTSPAAYLLRPPAVLIYLLCVYGRVASLLSVVLLLQFRCPPRVAAIFAVGLGMIAPSSNFRQIIVFRGRLYILIHWRLKRYAI